MVLFSVMAVVPETTSLAHAQSGATVSVTPSFNAADIGGTFQVSVDVNGASNFIAYDVILQYDPTALSAVSGSLNCFGAGTVFGTVSPSTSVFPVTQSTDNLVGQAECAGALLGGVVVPTASGHILTVSLQSLGPFGSALTIMNPQIIVEVNGGAVQIPVSINNGTFLSPPVLSFIKPNATVAPTERVSRLSHGDTTVDLQGFIMLSPTSAVAGFGGVRFTIIDPSSNVFTVDSNINFMLPGNSTTVTAQFNFVTNSGGATGTYVLFATLLRCPLPTSCADGATVQGLFFKVKA